MQTVFDVLERQGHRTLLPDAVLLSILDELIVRIDCGLKRSQKALFGPANDKVIKMDEMKENCIIVDSTLTGIYNQMNGMKCDTAIKVAATPMNHTSISGTLSV
ncbi:hypothetical protein KIN20_025054 [Parelaphostrongylus tenuis]|uniref:Uncharacterized protein n=1 Tax=Parelaphostrongylus tenuis TaxID=148309 RepID=A0AAD5N8A8_PARTN|nr:hypothetical protein KIN20_025054 [Parelaphostrongylus tenuis]